ncbi:hypothetical protein C0J52_06291 [Blattella germanica]|nr:hypothetical protein C0J52_06291 [Blattella germanica]
MQSLEKIRIMNTYNPVKEVFGSKPILKMFWLDSFILYGNMGYFQELKSYRKHNNPLRLKRLKWAERVVRMEEGRIPRKVENERIGGKRMVGRPRIQWEEMVMVGAKNSLGVSTGEQWQDVEVIGEHCLGRAWSEEGPQTWQRWFCLLESYGKNTNGGEAVAKWEIETRYWLSRE